MSTWIHRPAQVVVAADPAGDALAGLRVAVKDNVDVAGMPTTAACPSFAYDPAESATAVERLLAQRAAVVGKTNLDQFATGLVGTRSPHGAVPSPIHPSHVAGGSSSGSAAAVALHEADIGVGTDTAGSGRVPAAFCGVVGLKGTQGWVPNRGVVPACASFDCTTVFARTIGEAAAAMRVMAGFDPADPSSRRRPRSTRPTEIRRLGMPFAARMTDCDDRTRAVFAEVVATAPDRGFEVVEVDLDAYFAAGDLLYGGAFVAERHAAVGAFLAGAPADGDPVVTGIVGAAADLSASDFAADQTRLAGLRRRAEQVWNEVDAVVLPTAPFHPTIDEVEADPVGVNARLGRFVSGCNLVDWCAAAVPWPTPAGSLPFGVQVLGPAWSDEVVWRAAARLTGTAEPDRTDEQVLLAVVGAHLEGQPLNEELTDRDAELIETTHTAPHYRMVVLDGPLPKPGLVRVGPGGSAVEVEVWALSPAAFGSFVADVPPPLTIGTVRLADGASVKGFLCEEVATGDARDISEYGGWRGWLAHARS